MRTDDMRLRRREFPFAPLGLHRFALTTHGLRRGLHSYAASRLAWRVWRDLPWYFPIATQLIVWVVGTLLGLGGIASAQTAAIGEVGIQGYFVTGGLPTRVRVVVADPSPKLPERILAIPDK